MVTAKAMVTVMHDDCAAMGYRGSNAWQQQQKVTAMETASVTVTAKEMLAVMHDGNSDV